MSYHDSIVVVIVAGKGVPQRLYYLFIGNNTWLTLDYNNNDIYQILYLFILVIGWDIIKRYQIHVSYICFAYVPNIGRFSGHYLQNIRLLLKEGKMDIYAIQIIVPYS